MKKWTLLLSAILLFLFYNYGFYQWIQSGHNFKDVWNGITSDWFLAITVFDMSLFTLLCLIWLVRDMKQHNKSSLQIILVILACIITGVVALLTYLAFRGQSTPKGVLQGSH